MEMLNPFDVGNYSAAQRQLHYEKGESDLTWGMVFFLMFWGIVYFEQFRLYWKACNLHRHSSANCVLPKVRI